LQNPVMRVDYIKSLKWMGMMIDDACSVPLPSCVCDVNPRDMAAPHPRDPAWSHTPRWRSIACAHQFPPKKSPQVFPRGPANKIVVPPEPSAGGPASQPRHAKRPAAPERRGRAYFTRQKPPLTTPTTGAGTKGGHPCCVLFSRAKRSGRRVAEALKKHCTRSSIPPTRTRQFPPARVPASPTSRTIFPGVRTSRRCGGDELRGAGLRRVAAGLRDHGGGDPGVRVHLHGGRPGRLQVSLSPPSFMVLGL
jgi:hypothetical protein